MGLSDSLWKLIVNCWDSQPGERPTIEVVLGQGNQHTRYWIPPSPVTASLQLEIEEHLTSSDMHGGSLGMSESRRPSLPVLIFLSALSKA